jgi:hypothetical protein
MDRTGMEEVKSLFSGDMILYLKDPKDSTRKLRSDKYFNKVAGYKTNIQTS